MINEFGLSPIP